MIKRWWRGTEVQEQEFGSITNTKHWTSKAAHKIVKFYLDHWKYLITLCISVIGLVLAWKFKI